MEREKVPMTKAFDGSLVPARVLAPCGNVARFDHGSGYGYICEHCWAVLGSAGMPRQCERS